MLKVSNLGLNTNKLLNYQMPIALVHSITNLCCMSIVFIMGMLVNKLICKLIVAIYYSKRCPHLNPIF